MRFSRALAEYLLIQTSFLLVRPLPVRVALALGRGFGSLLHRFDRKHRRIALSNLQLALGDDFEEKARWAISKECFRHFGSLLFEFLLLPRYVPEHVTRRVDTEGIEVLREAYAQNRGVLLLTAHFGNWEIMGVNHGYIGFPLAVVARKLDNPLLEKMLVRYRSRSGARVIHKRSAVRQTLLSLKRGEGVAYLIDQRAQAAEGIFVDFFGKPASTTSSLAAIALRTGAPIVAATCFPDGRGRYRAVYGPVIEPRRTGDRKKDILELTQCCTLFIEEQVRSHPRNWLWMHRRWRSHAASKDGRPDENTPQASNPETGENR